MALKGRATHQQNPLDVVDTSFISGLGPGRRTADIVVSTRRHLRTSVDNARLIGWTSAGRDQTDEFIHDANTSVLVLAQHLTATPGTASI